MKKIFSQAAMAAVALATLLFGVGAQAQITDEQFGKMMEKYLASDKAQAELGGTVEKYFRKRQEEAQKQQAEGEKNALEDQFKNPVQVAVGDSPFRGPKDAKITIVEFSDFQCPFCKRGYDTMEKVMKDYPKDVKVVFKNMPLPFHNQAMPAAKAAVAAGKQGKFWEMHDHLFNNQPKLDSPDFYTNAAKEIGADVEKFKKDFADPATEASVKADAELGQKNGIQGTPGFFVNGVAVKGAYPPEHFKMIIERWLNGGAKPAGEAKAADAKPAPVAGVAKPAAAPEKKG